MAKSKPENQDNLDGNVHIEKPSSNDPDANIVESDTKESVDDNQWIPRFPVFHNLVGNHELYNFDRVQLLDYMHGHRHSADSVDGGDVQFYYAFTPHPNFVFIMLDAYDISILGYKYCDNKHPHYVQADKLLNEHNPNQDKHAPVPSYGLDRRFRAFNGAFGKRQLLWLEEKLKIAQKRRDNVILCCHVPVYSKRNRDYDILQWDYKEMIALIAKYSCIKMYFAGHDHIGDFCRDPVGVHHVTFEGAIEAKPNKNCFATVHFGKGQCRLKGYGMIKSRVMNFRPF